jgi:hypothetical protein
MNILLLPAQEPEKKKSKKKKAKTAHKVSKKKKAEAPKEQSAKADTSTARKDTLVKTLPEAPVVTHARSEVPVIQYDLFKGHALQRVHENPVIRHNPKEDWLPLVTIFIVFLFSLINVFYQKKFREFISSLTRRTVTAGREENIFTQRLRILLFVLFSLITSCFLYQAAVLYNLKPHKLTGFQFYSVILFLVFFIYLIKILGVKLMGFILKTERENQEYSNNILLYLNMLSFGLFPLVVLIGFTPQLGPELLVKTGCVFILSAILFRVGRGFILAVSNPLLSKFYLFLYLCTLEILPLVVILKLFVDQLL